MLHRVDVEARFEDYENLELLKLEIVKIPKLQWSCRAVNILPFRGASSEKITIKEKIILTGMCLYEGNKRPFVARLSVSFM